MIPHGFGYCAPGSVAEVIAALAEDPTGSTLLGGGTWVVPEMNRGVRSVRRVVDLRNAGLAQ
ncbi:MAG: FAD binding domain-containing protein, partial [Trebonia sp.]